VLWFLNATAIASGYARPNPQGGTVMKAFQ